MAVIQISKIQHRRGLASDLPNQLAEGEFGFATDTGEVFIGAPNTDLVATRTGYPYQNIKVLTEFDVQRSITGDVYYHGPLKSYKIPKGISQPFLATDPLIGKIPLFLLSEATCGCYDVSLSRYNATLVGATSNVPVGIIIGNGGLMVAGIKTTSPYAETQVAMTNWASADPSVSLSTPLLSAIAGSPPTTTVTGPAITFSATCEQTASGDTQVYLNVINFTNDVTYPDVIVHISGREWLAVQPA